MTALAWRRWVPGSLFVRLLVLLMVMALLGHALALGVMLQWLGPPDGPPPGMGHGPDRGPPPPGWWWGMTADVAVRLLAMAVAAWWGARWLAQPVNRLAHAAKQWSLHLQGPVLMAEGPTELREATHAFNEMQAQIRQHLSDRDRFVAAVSHDLRTPLTRLRLRAECLSDHAQRQRFAQDIAEMDDMIRSTLDHLSPASPNEPMAPVDVNALVQSLVDNEADTGQPVTMAHTSHAPAPARVMGQAVALKRCVGNLLGNALRYGHCAEVGVTVTDGHVFITVADKGPGLPSEELEKVKQPFYRTEHSRNRHTGGLGLGLSIANDVALNHRGQLQLSNRPQGGLLATLVLPVASARDHTQPPQ